MTSVKTKKANKTLALLVSILMLMAGVYVLMHPVDAMLALALYIGRVMIIAGIGYVITSFSHESGWYLLVGIIDLLVGIIFVTNLGITAASIPVIFAIWILAIGAVQLVMAFQFRHFNSLWYWPLLSGIVGILFAFMILSYPTFGALTITVIMGIYIVIYGIVGIIEYIHHSKKLKKMRL